MDFGYHHASFRYPDDDRPMVDATADLPAVLLIDETVVKQRGQQFVLFAAVDPENASSHSRVGCSVEKLPHKSTIPDGNRRVVWSKPTNCGDRWR